MAENSVLQVFIREGTSSVNCQIIYGNVTSELIASMVLKHCINTADNCA